MNKKARKILATILTATFIGSASVPVMAEDTIDPIVSSSQKDNTSELEQVYQAYADFLRKYQIAQANEFYKNDMEALNQSGINTELAVAGGVNLHFTLVDLAQDGIPELFIADYPSPYTDPQYRVFDTYGFSNGRAERLFETYSMGYRSNYYIMNNGIIYCYGSGGAFNNIRLYYGLESDSTMPTQVQFVEYDGFDRPSSPLYYKGTNNTNNKTPISEYEYNNIINSYQYDSSLLWHPISDLTSLRSELFKNNIPVYVNGLELDCDQPPIIQNGRALVPLRAIFEALGASVSWDNATRTVTSIKGDTTLRLTVGSNTLYKNGNGITIDVPAQIINDRTIVPVRAVSEAFDAQVVWDAADRTVTITL